MELDRNRSYGTVYGPSKVAFEQDGQQFDQDGVLIGPEKATRKAKAADAAPVDDELAAQLKE